jgi:hypothetical protein
MNGMLYKAKARCFRSGLVQEEERRLIFSGSSRRSALALRLLSLFEELHQAVD